MAKVSLDNGNSYKTAEELDADEMVRLADYVDPEICEELHGLEWSPREWTTAYLAAHEAKWGSPLVIG